MRGEALLKRLGNTLEKHQVPYTAVIRHGDARKKLPSQAKKLGVDVIVMGRRGVTGDKKSPVGSVSQYVVEHAPCSVVIIKEDKDLPSSTEEQKPE
jgi:nucleotide-binding universal stress UspA family protein